VDGVAVAVPFRVNVKSLVWYRPDVFSRRGLEVPGTLAELEATVARIEDGGTSPWCFGIVTQRATGWVATDWTEETVLRLSGPEVYDRWVAGDVEFADPEIATAYDAVRALLLAPGRSAGGISGILRTTTQQSANQLFTDPPECLLHRQGSFAFGWMPEGTRFGSDGDIDFFVLPGLGPAETPLLLGSTSAVAFDDRPEVAAVLAHLASPGSTRVWSEAGGFVSPRRSSPADGEIEPVDQAVRDLIEMATAGRPDASDAMAPEIGSDLLWEEITSWVADVATYDQLAMAGLHPPGATAMSG
jgi:alpha-glucoside transport system substrate-binding protein